MSDQNIEVIVQDIPENSIHHHGAIVESERAEAVQRVQAAFVIAKKFPRNEQMAITRIKQACQRLTLAEVAMYAFPRGGKVVTGPSIRLAEVMAQCWGNNDFGMRELEHTEGRSVVESYCSDLETNVHQRRTFIVHHKRRVGKLNKELDDPRDIYEHVANHGARRLRACILGIIPKDVIDMAVEQVKLTVKKGSGDLLIDRVNNMVFAFSSLGVSTDMIEKKLGHAASLINMDEFIELKSIYTSLKDGESKRQHWFKMGSDPEGGKAAELNDSIESKATKT